MDRSTRRFVIGVVGILLLLGGIGGALSIRSEEVYQTRMARMRDDLMIADDLEAINDQLAGRRPREVAGRTPAPDFTLAYLLCAVAGMGGLITLLLLIPTRSSDQPRHPR